MTVVLKQSHIVCTFDLTPLPNFKTTKYVLADIEFDSSLGIEYLIKEIDQLSDAAVAFFKRDMELKPDHLWVRYLYSYDDSENRRNWGRKAFCVFNPSYPLADINATENELIRVDFTKKARI